MTPELPWTVVALIVAFLVAVIGLATTAGLLVLSSVRRRRERQSRVSDARYGAVFDHEQHDRWPTDDQLEHVIRDVFAHVDPPPPDVIDSFTLTDLRHYIEQMEEDIKQMTEAARRRHPSGGQR